MTGEPNGSRRAGAYVLAGVAAATVAFVLARAAVGPDPNVLTEAPGEILGRWATDDPRYAERAFVIRPDEFHLEVGPDSILEYRLKEVRRLDEPGHDAYEVVYFTREGETVQRLELYPEGVVRLRNPPDVLWVRR